MIDVCAASLQTSLQGLDNMTAEGTDAVDNMNDLVDTLGNLGSSDQFSKLAHQGIKEAKRYLKTEFKGHVSREKICADHCTTYALNDPVRRSSKDRVIPVTMLSASPVSLSKRLLKQSQPR